MSCPKIQDSRRYHVEINRNDNKKKIFTVQPLLIVIWHVNLLCTFNDLVYFTRVILRVCKSVLDVYFIFS